MYTAIFGLLMLLLGQMTNFKIEPVRRRQKSSGYKALQKRKLCVDDAARGRADANVVRENHELDIQHHALTNPANGYTRSPLVVPI